MSNEVLPASGVVKDKVFYFPVRVYYEDTDAGGIVYYANYLKFAERARTEFIRALDFNQQEGLEGEDKHAFAVRRVEVDYKAPAILDDALVVTCEIKEAKGASAVMYQEVRRRDQILAAIDVKVAYLSLAQKRPVRLPEGLLAKINAL